jgi:hypothetical protein
MAQHPAAAAAAADPVSDAGMLGRTEETLQCQNKHGVWGPAGGKLGVEAVVGAVSALSREGWK